MSYPSYDFAHIFVLHIYLLYDMNHFKYRMSKFFDWAWVGAITIATEMVMPFVTPIGGYIFFMIMAVIADTFTGIWAAMKQKKQITSRGLWRTVEKIVIAGIAIMLSHGFEILFVPDIPMTKGVAMVIAFAELKSNLENYHKITGVDVGTVWIDMIKERIMPTPPPPPPTENNEQ
jgi:phage-related holin